MGRGALFRASDDAQVELIEMDDVHEGPEPRVALGLQVEDTDSVFARLTRLGVAPKAPPRVRPWGMYGFGVLDPNGVPINVYEPAESRDPGPG